MIQSNEQERIREITKAWYQKSEQKFQEVLNIAALTALITYSGGTLFYTAILDEILPLELVFRLLPVATFLGWLVLYKRKVVRAFSFGHFCYQSLFISNTLLSAYVFPDFLLINILTNIPIILVPALFLTWKPRQTLINILLGLFVWLGGVCFWNWGSPAIPLFLTSNLILLPIAAGTYFYSDYKYCFSLKLFTAYSELENANVVLKAKNERIESQVVMLDESVRFQEKILSIISHDLKGPIGSVIQLLQLVNDQKKTLTVDEYSDMIEQILITSNHMSGVLDGLLNWTTARNGKMYVNQEKLNVHDEISEVIDLYALTASQKQIQISLFNTSPVFVQADKKAFQLIMRNLVSNALKFTRSGGVIQIHCRQIRDEVEVVVEDNGVGISAPKLSQLFTNPVSTFGTDQEKGTGLGLAFCKEVIELNQGKISVQSEINQGSKFTVTLKGAKE